MPFLQNLTGPPDVEKLAARSDIKALEKALVYPKDPHIRLAAVKALGKLKSVQSVDALIESLKDSSEDVRIEAADVLGKLSSPRGVGPLTEALSDKFVRYSAAKALGELGDTRAVAPLIAVLNKENGRTAVVKALGQLGDARAVEPLITLAASDRYTRQEVLVALGRLAARLPDGVQRSRIIEKLTEALKNGEEQVFKAAADGLEMIPDQRAVEALIAGCNGKWPNFAAFSLQKLYRSGRLDARSKQHILAFRDELAAKHEDGPNPDCAGERLSRGITLNL
jgi:HEAT repeat protein